MSKPEIVDLFGKYKIMCIGEDTYRISIDGEELEMYYFTNLDSALLMCLIRRYLHNKPDNEQEEFARVIASMLNMYKNTED